MARRSDEELAAEYARKQRLVTERMARKADPVVGKLEDGARPLLNMLSDAQACAGLTKEDGEVCLAACRAVQGAISRRVDAFAEKNNKTAKMF